MKNIDGNLLLRCHQLVERVDSRGLHAASSSAGIIRIYDQPVTGVNVDKPIDSFTSADELETWLDGWDAAQNMSMKALVKGG